MRIFILAGHSASLIRFRGELIKEMCDRGYKVHVVAPFSLDSNFELDRLSQLGVTSHNVILQRAGLNPLSDLRFLVRLIKLFREHKPDLVLGYTIKPVIWGLVASWVVGVKRRVALITGLGFAFTGEVTGVRRLVNRVATGLYRFALKKSTLIFFQNPDDRSDFDRLGLLAKNIPVAVVNGSGVDLKEFIPAELPKAPLRFLLIARLLGDKGIREYAAAAAEVRIQYPEVEFHLVGGLDPNPDGISEAEVVNWDKSGSIVWHGALLDVRPVIASSHVYVLPSYREGTPRTVLEAMSMGRAIITTDAPGCRETVVDGENGYLVPPRSTTGLVNAMLRFIKSPELIPIMGSSSRRLAEKKYDVNKVNKYMLEAMDLNG